MTKEDKQGQSVPVRISKRAKMEILKGVHLLGLGNLHLDKPITETKQLPFVTKTRKKMNFWNVTPKENYDTPGDFTIDCNTGTQYACAYLNNMVNDVGLPLTWIVGKMNKLETGEGHGIEVGFLCTIQEFAKLGAKFAQVAEIDLAKLDRLNKAFFEETMKNPRAKVSDVLKKIGKD